MTSLRHTTLLADSKVLPPKGLNTNLYLDINRFARHTTWLHGFMHAYALWLGPVLVVAVFVVAYAIMWWRRDYHATVLMVVGGLATLLALGFNQIIGHAAKELRPYDTLRHVLVLVPRAHDYAFPSDHAVLAGALVAAIVLVRPTTTSEPRGRVVPIRAALGVTGVVLGLFVCFARVYVGAHYPGDVVAGFLLGALVVCAASLARPFAYRFANMVEPTVLGVVLRRAPSMSGSSVTGSRSS